ncbi:transcriptional regulator [Prauserella muralis]|uniref:Transcriptional regulator n=2 Tax=Prauserella muralis TaxID=588067 RepID=A0A2V4B1U5_9PSEU|nr:transcriptional regulator [Prauserella muralis]
MPRKLTAITRSPVRDLLTLTQRPEVISFAGGLPAPELFDLGGWQAAFGQALSEAAGRRNLQYAPTEGDPALRAAVAARLTRRGLPTSADDLLVTTGSQQALTLLASALLDPGAVVAVEEPTYLAALQSFQAAGARIVPVASDADGLDPDALARVIERERPTLLYLVPTFANPTGRTLTAERRQAVAALTATHGVWVVEDDPYSELRYQGPALPPLAAAPSAGAHVVYVGSFSKIGSPGMRLGWLRAPTSLRPALTVAKQAADLHTSTVDQAAAAIYLATRDLDAHVDTLCAAYRARKDAMVATVDDAMPDGTERTDPGGGMFVWLRLPSGVDAESLLPAALERHVAFVPGVPFYAGTPDRTTLRLSFTTHTPERIAEGIGRLAGALRRS